jgi:hypothetical protein
MNYSFFRRGASTNAGNGLQKGRPVVMVQDDSHNGRGAARGKQVAIPASHSGACSARRFADKG